MATMSTATRDEFKSDLRLIQEEVRSGVTQDYTKRKDRHWEIWLEYCDSCSIDPFLSSHSDPVPILQIFAQRFRDGRLAPSGKPVRSKTVSDALCSVGQKFAVLGSDDPRYNSYGKIDFRLSRQYKSFGKKDKPPSRVKPLPITVVIAALNFACVSSPTIEREAIANMICIAFFFCLRPGEYTGTTTDDQAFSLEDVTLYLGDRRLHNDLSPDHEIEAATSVTYLFTEQKNGDKGEIIAHARSGDSLCCPVTATIRQLMIHKREFRRRNLPYDGRIKLASYYNSRHVRVPVKAAQITKAVRWHASLLQPVTGIDPAQLSARSLRAGGAMALLAGQCDTNTIKLLCRWHSDAMMRYLHQQSLPIFQRLSSKMFNNGSYTFLPEDWVPAAAE